MERPQVGEDEEVLVKFQQEFLASRQAPSAKVCGSGDRASGKRKTNDTFPPPRDVVDMESLPTDPPVLEPPHPVPAKKSRFQSQRTQNPDLLKHVERPTRPSGKQTQEGLDPEMTIDKQDRGLAACISSILERDTSGCEFTMPSKSTQPFPTVLKNNTLTQADSGAGQSVFIQQVEREGLGAFGVTMQQERHKLQSFHTSPTDTAHLQPTDKSRLVDGRGLSASMAGEEARKIHAENLAKMADMSLEEILREQQELLAVLDPGIVAFLKAKSQKSNEMVDVPEPQPTKKPQKKEAQRKAKHVNEMSSEVAMDTDKSWINMDKVEYGKLEWMKDLPPPSADDVATGKQARFDFHGNLVPADVNVATNMGLHHHGDEPERAGYSVGELFQLARSTNVQQNTIALNTLASILRKAKAGLLDSVLQTPIVPAVLDGGIVFLLRWACDHSTEAVVAAAVSALSALLCNPYDEAGLDAVWTWHQGASVSALFPVSSEQAAQRSLSDQLNPDNTVQETDADVARRDVVQGLVSRMVLIERLHYILDCARRPQAPTVLCILQILTRLARHGAQTAYQISRNVKLMNLLFHHFLPTAWDVQDEEGGVSRVYGRPVAACMRLVGSLCQAGRGVASSLLASHRLDAALMGYLAVTPQELQLSVLEAEALHRESLRVWKILLSYGLAVNVYLDLYEPIMKCLQSLEKQSLTDSQWQPSLPGAYLVSALESLIPAATTTPVKHGFNRSEPGGLGVSGGPAVDWSCVEGVLPVLRLYAHNWLSHLTHNYLFQQTELQMPTACLNFLATYYSRRPAQLSSGTVEFTQQIEQFALASLLPFLQSLGLSKILTQLRCSSNLVSVGERRREVASCLPEFGCDAEPCRVPVTGACSAVGFVTALSRLLLALCSRHKHLLSQVARVFVNHEDLCCYLRQVTSCPHSPLDSNHFTRYENLLHYFLIKLSSLLVAGEDSQRMMHQLALDLMGRLQDGDEFMAHDLLSTVLFNQDFIPEGGEEAQAIASMAEMKLSDAQPLKSATLEQISTNKTQLLSAVFQALPLIRTHYFQAFAHMEHKTFISRCRHQQQAAELGSLVTGACQSYLMPCDWVFLPLVELYNASAAASGAGVSGVSASAVPLVTGVLQWVLMLETWRPRALLCVPLTLKVSRLMCIFLTGNQLFLERTVYPYLAALFCCYTSPRTLAALDFDQPLPGLPCFYDMYMEFVDQFEAVSYGDALFSAFTALPMLQSQSVMLRRALWQERPHLLRVFSLPLNQLLLDVRGFLEPEESDGHLLQLYCTALLSGVVQPSAPLLFLLAIHHLNRYLFRTGPRPHQPLHRSLWARVLQCGKQGLQDTILRFKQVNLECQQGLELYRELPAIRQKTLDHHRQLALS